MLCRKNSCYGLLICHLSKSHKLGTTCQCVGGWIRQLCISVLRQAVQTCTDVCMVEKGQESGAHLNLACVCVHVCGRNVSYRV